MISSRLIPEKTLFGEMFLLSHKNMIFRRAFCSYRAGEVVWWKRKLKKFLKVLKKDLEGADDKVILQVGEAAGKT